MHTTAIVSTDRPELPPQPVIRKRPISGCSACAASTGSSRWIGTAARVISKEHAANLERLTALIETGEVTSSIDRIYPLDRVPEAMRHLEAGNARGKVAITI